MKQSFSLFILIGLFNFGFSQEYKNILGANFSFRYNKNESSLSGNSLVTISSSNENNVVFGSFISKRLMLGGGIGFNSSKFLSDDGTNVVQDKATGFNIYPDVRYYFPLKHFSLFLENTIYLGYSERSSRFNRPIRSYDNGILLNFGAGFFLGKIYLEASLNAASYSKIRTTTPIDNTSERITNVSSFEMLQDFTNINLGIYYHFGKSKHHTVKEK